MANRVKLNKSEVRALARAEATKMIVDDIKVIRRLARAAARGSHPMTTDSTGFLSRNIESLVDRKLFGGIRGTVGVNRQVTYQMPAHDGAKPHRIAAKRVNRMGRKELRFYWRRKGQIFEGPRVNHPGMEGKRYLTRPLVAVCGRPNRVRGAYRIIIF